MSLQLFHYFSLIQRFLIFCHPFVLTFCIITHQDEINFGLESVPRLSITEKCSGIVFCHFQPITQPYDRNMVQETFLQSIQ